MKRKPYPKYKDSGVEWLGQVPESWEVKRLKRAVSLSSRDAEVNEDHSLPFIGLENIESWTGRVLMPEFDVIPAGVCNSFEQGQVLFGKLRPYLAKACLPDFKGLCSTEVLVIESRDFDRRMLLYLLLSEGFIDLVNSSTYGSKMPRASWDFIGECFFPIPPYCEQKQIADFLDRETARVDDLIAKQERMIELLAEKRGALISQAVTRGLNSRVTLQDSGVEWLGEVPEHWEALALKWVTSSVQTGGTPSSRAYFDEGVFDWFTPADFTDNLVLSDSKRKISEQAVAHGEVKVFPVDSVLVVGIGATLGKVGYIKTSASSNQQINAVIPNSRLLAKFLAYELSVFTDVLKGLANSATLAILNQEKTKQVFVSVPPLSEQKAIVQYLDQHTAKIDALTDKAREAIALMKEHRSSLIAAAVTGKIDVRGQ